MSVFQKRGKWWVLYRLPNGNWRREPVGTSHALAKEVESKRRAEASEAIHFPERVNNARPFKTIADKYFQLHGPTLRSNSWQSQLKRILKFFGSMPVGKIKSSDVQHFYNLTEAETCSATANRHLTLLKAIYNKALAWGDFYGINPCNGVKKKQEKNHRLRYLSNEEMKQILEVCHPRLYPVVACALMTGMRKGEILRLDWRDIDFESNTIQILETKSGKPRKIPMLTSLKGILMELGPKAAGPVFELPEIMLRRYFALALTDARIPEFRFHDLRHTFASHFAMKTGDLPALQRLLGHASLQMTLRYAHLSDKHLTEKMAQMEAVLPALNHAPNHAGIAPLIAPPYAALRQNVLESPIQTGS